jgi:hypothetical protein
VVRVLTRPSEFALVLVGLLVACAPSSPTPLVSSATGAPTKPSYTLAPPTPSLSPIESPGAGPPGVPYSATDIEALLQGAPRGFPPELKTPETAAAFASRIWSFDGRPFRTLWFDGSCESGRCEINATGLPAFAPTVDDVDVFTLVLDQSNGIYSEPSPPSLRGLPPDLAPKLDALARSLDTQGQFKSKSLLGVEWLIPPPDDAFALRYGNGNEEQDPTAVVVLSRSLGRIISVTTRP